MRIEWLYCFCVFRVRRNAFHWSKPRSFQFCWVFVHCLRSRKLCLDREISFRFPAHSATIDRMMTASRSRKITSRGPICVMTHGGCGAVAHEQHELRNAICQRAADAAYEILIQGGSSLNAVERAVSVMEDSEVLNAGRGGYLQADGVPRRDASIMTGDVRAGSVAQVPWLRNPIRLARYILEQQAYVMLSGREALELAIRLGHEFEVGATPAKVEYWLKNMSEACRKLDYSAMARQWRNSHTCRAGTVGAVALDSSGQISAGTSTGGTGQCYPGRIGDSPVIGAGTYCTSRIGVSMTGTGEHILVLLSAKTFCDRVANGMSLPGAARRALADLEKIGNAAAGLIALDRDGRMSSIKNTEFMPVGKRPKQKSGR